MIVLREYTSSDTPFGNTQGKEVFRRLSDFVDSQPRAEVFCISMKGISLTDASFPRESVVALAKQYRGEKGFFLKDLKDGDLIDNWSYAALAKDQPLIVWSSTGYQVIGPVLSADTQKLLDFVLAAGEVSTAAVSEGLEISVQNASTKLKKLFNQGLVMRSERSAETGGIEFIYKALK